MNKKLKATIISINVLMLILSGFWYYRDNDFEPFIVAMGQICVILGLVFENQATQIFTKGIDNSDVKIKRKPGDNIHTEGVKDSTIDIS